jgi:protein SCO1
LLKLPSKFIFASFIVWASASFAYDGKLAPKAAEETIANSEQFKINEKLGANLDLTLKVTDEDGVTRPLKDYFSDHQPVMLSLVYYSCPSLCNFHLNGVFDVLKKVDWPLGEKYKLLALSFDPKETPEVAAAKRRNYLQLLGQPKSEKGVHFLTATPETILAITGQVGFNYKWDEPSQQWAHSSAAIVLSPEGQISRYLHGIQFEAKDVKLALSDATEGRIGSIVDQMIWYCFMYDPKVSKYTIYAFRLVQIAAGLMVFVLLLWFIPFWRRQRLAKTLN